MSISTKEGTSTQSEFDTFLNILQPYERLKDLQGHLTKRKEDLYAGRT